MFDPYVLIIAVSVIIALSYIFNIISSKLKIPSVLLLITTGIIIKYYFNSQNINIDTTLNNSLEILGILGLIMIVLEAAVDLKISKKKIPIIGKSLVLSFIVLFISAMGIAIIIQNFLNETFINSLVYAIPLSIVSSAVLIPSVHKLEKKKKEFMIYESTFSDILGIMFFNFIVFNEVGAVASMNGLITILITIIISIILSYLLVFSFSKLNSGTKIFLMIAILSLIYAIGKQFHLSSLLIILIFGIVLNNSGIFYIGPFKKIIDLKKVEAIADDFKMITSESAFVIRTFFFIVFGMSINLNVLLDVKVVGIGLIILILMYIIRFINFKIFLKTNIFPEIFLAPRGLITILLFYSIPTIYLIHSFSVGILFFVILSSSIIMMIALIATPNAKFKEISVYDLGIDLSNQFLTNDPNGPFCEIDPQSDDLGTVNLEQFLEK